MLEDRWLEIMAESTVRAASENLPMKVVAREGSVQLVLIRIQGKASVVGSDDQVITEPVQLQDFHRYSYREERFTDHIGGPEKEDALAALLLPGGHLRFEYDGRSPHLVGITEFVSRRALNTEELQLLVSYTTGQWSDGIGENLSQKDVLGDGRTIHCQTDDPLEVKQLVV
jgi:hypothetical protein